MTILQSYIFDTSANFTKSNTQVDEIADVGKLGFVNDPGNLFTETFASSVGFTFNALLAEFNAGLVRQIDQTPTNSVFGGLMSSKDLNWNKTNPITGTLNGVPTFGTGRMVCMSAQGAYWEYTTTALETLKFKYTPFYTGAPPANINIVSSYNGVNNNDRFYMTNSPSGNNIRFALNNNTGTQVFALTIATGFAAVSGQDYEFEVSLDSVAGLVRIFRDGVLVYTGSPGAWSRGGVLSRVYLGACPVVYNQSEGSFDDLIVFSDIQHTASYVAGYSVPAAIYLSSAVQLPNFSYSGVGEIQTLSNFTTSQSGTPQYVIGGQYWNGAAWVASANTYAQSSSAADILANLGTFITGGGTTFTVAAIFSSSNTLSSVDNLEITYSGEVYSNLGYLEPIQALQVSSLTAYGNTEVIPVNTSLGTILKIDGILTWFNTVSGLWETSDGSIAQSNTALEINDNVSSLGFDSNSSVIIRWVFATTDTSITPEISLSTICYNFGGIVVNATKCIVYGYLKDVSDVPLAGIKLNFQLYFTGSKYYKEAANNVISPQDINSFTDANGYFSLPLIRSSEFENGATYKLTINFKKVNNKTNIIDSKSNGVLTFDVPDSDTKDITDLLPIP